MSDDDTTATSAGKSRRGPGRPSNAERAASLADEIEQTLKGVADLLEPHEVDVDSIAGILKRDAPAIARYLAGLADKSTAAAGLIARLLSAFGAVRAFGPLTGALAGRVFARHSADDDAEPFSENGDLPSGQTGSFQTTG